MTTIRFARRNLVLVAVIVLGLGAGAYAASKTGAGDLKSMRFVGNDKTIKDGQRKNVKVNCKKGELILDAGFAITPDVNTAPTPEATILSFLPAQRQSKGKRPDQYILDVANLRNEGRPFLADAFAYCLKK